MPATGTDLLIVERGGTLYKATAAEIAALGGGGGGGGGDSSDPLALATEFSTTAPPAPATGVRLFARSLAGRRRPAFIGPSGLDSGLQSFLAANKIGLWSAQGNGTNGFNNANPGLMLWNFGHNATGTAQARNVATTNDYTRMRRLGFLIDANGRCGTRHGLLQFTRRAGFEYIARLGISAQPSSGTPELVVMMASNAGLIQNIGTGGAAGIEIRGSGFNNNWRISSAAVSSDTPTLHSTIPTTEYPLNTGSVDMYEVRIFCAPAASEVHWALTRLTGGSGQMTQGTITSALPPLDQLLAPQIVGLATASSGYSIDVVQQYIETDL